MLEDDDEQQRHALTGHYVGWAYSCVLFGLIVIVISAALIGATVAYVGR